MIDMADYEAFQRRIRENPKDDAPRLIFADWLDEHGYDENLTTIMRQRVSGGIFRGTLDEWLQYGYQLLPVFRVEIGKNPVIFEVNSRRNVPRSIALHFNTTRQIMIDSGYFLALFFMFEDGPHSWQLPAAHCRFMCNVVLSRNSTRLAASAVKNNACIFYFSNYFDYDMLFQRELLMHAQITKNDTQYNRWALCNSGFMQ